VDIRLRKVGEDGAEAEAAKTIDRSEAKRRGGYRSFLSVGGGSSI